MRVVQGHRGDHGEIWGHKMHKKALEKCNMKKIHEESQPQKSRDLVHRAGGHGQGFKKKMKIFSPLVMAII